MTTNTIEGYRSRFALDHPIRQSLETLLPILRYAVRRGDVRVQNDPYDAETSVEVSSVDEAWSEISSVDESVLYIGSDWFMLILENGPDCISDYRGSDSAAIIARMAGR